MREIKDHAVDGDECNSKIKILAELSHGNGGAPRYYSIQALSEDEDMGLSIFFQQGNPATERINGVTMESLLAVVADRLKQYQAGPFNCQDNADALEHTKRALWYLQDRTRKRLARGVWGTNKV